MTFSRQDIGFFDPSDIVMAGRDKRVAQCRRHAMTDFMSNVNTKALVGPLPMKLIVLMIVLNMNPTSKASRPQNKVLSQNNCNSFPYLTARHLAEKQLQYFQYFKPLVYMT